MFRYSYGGLFQWATIFHISARCTYVEGMDQAAYIPDDSISGNVMTDDSSPSDSRPSLDGWVVAKSELPELTITLSTDRPIEVQSVTVDGNIKSRF